MYSVVTIVNNTICLKVAKSVVRWVLECKVDWPLGNITTNKASGDNEISVELF